MNSFADHFQQSYVQSQSSPLSTVTFSSVLCLSKFEEDVFKVLQKIKSKFISGPDVVPAFILNDCANAFAYPLTILFNLSLKLSIYPSLWKRSVIRPIFKNGDRTLIEKYRPISLMCNFSKVYEILLYDIICYCRPYISSFQHGFYKGRSIDINLCCFTQFVAESLNAESQVDVIFTDISKAFDRLDHFILLDKLNKFGLADSLINLLSSYLIGRSQSVTCSNVSSVNINVSSGVPQGTVLGPLLFIIFINDISENIESSCLLYTNDMKLFRRVNCVSDYLKLQNDLNLVSD